MNVTARPTETADLRRTVRDCIGETIPLRRRWVSAIMDRVIAPLLDQRDTALAEREARIAVLEGALKLCSLELEWQSDKAHMCGDPNFECPMQDIHGPTDGHRIARDTAREALSQGATDADA